MSKFVNVEGFLHINPNVIEGRFLNLMSYLLYNESEKRICMGVKTKCTLYQHPKLKRRKEDRILKPCSDFFSLLRRIQLCII